MIGYVEPALLHKAVKEVAGSQRELAKLLGTSLRTVQRYAVQGGLSLPDHLKQVIVALHPKNPTLAAKVAQQAGIDLATLGIHAAPGPQAARREHADSVLCAAADALQVMPAAARPGLAAAFARALELNVDLQGLAHLIAADVAPQAAKAPAAR